MMEPIIRLKESNCRDCYKCIRNCLLKAIRYSDGHAEIIPQECIQCGECVVTCPRRGHFVHSDMELVLRQRVILIKIWTSYLFPRLRSYAPYQTVRLIMIRDQTMIILLIVVIRF